MQVQCEICKGTGRVSDSHVSYPCPVCKETGFIEDGIIDMNLLDENGFVKENEVIIEEVKSVEIPIIKKRGRPKKNE